MGAGLLHGHILVGELDVGDGVVVLDVAPVGVLAPLIALVILEIHVHHNPVLIRLRSGQDVEDAADQAVAPPVVEIGEKLGHPVKEGGSAGKGHVRPLGRAPQELFHVDAQGVGDLIEGFNVHGDLPVFVFGDGGFALVNPGGQLLQRDFSPFAERTDAFAHLHTDF